MIIPSQGLQIVLAIFPVDFRCGHDALAALAQNKLGLDPHSGLIVVFRSKRIDRLNKRSHKSMDQPASRAARFQPRNGGGRQ